jgi:hypothetical protein
LGTLVVLGALRRADRDLRLTREWFPLDEEAWRGRRARWHPGGEAPKRRRWRPRKATG